MKMLNRVALALAVFALTAGPLLAQPAAPAPVEGQTGQPPRVAVLSGNGFGAGIGAAITILGAGYGFSRIGSAALESMARQPEVAGRVQTAMIVIAALLEGATFFALIVCILVAGKTPSLF